MSTILPVEPDEWDQLAGGRFYSTSAWLSFSGAEPGAASGAVVCCDDGVLEGAVPVAELTAQPMPLYRWNDVLAVHDLPLLPSAGLLVGPRQGYQTHFLVSKSKPARILVANLIDEVRQLHSAGGKLGERACVAMYMTTHDALTARSVGVSAQPVLLGADAWIEVPLGGWQAWLDSMTSKRARKIRKEVRRFREAGYEISHMSLSQCYGELAIAAARTQAKYGNVGQPTDYLLSLRRHVERMGAVAKVAVCSLGKGDPVGFCIYFVWDDTIFLRWCGFDYERLIDGATEYFNLLYYEQVRLAAKLGLRWIHAGIKSSEAKAHRGAELRPLWLVDLAEDSVLIGASDQVRRHNIREYQRLAEDSRTATALVDHDSWQVFA